MNPLARKLSCKICFGELTAESEDFSCLNRDNYRKQKYSLI